jgi:hypothetical protein
MTSQRVICVLPSIQSKGNHGNIKRTRNIIIGLLSARLGWELPVAFAVERSDEVAIQCVSKYRRVMLMTLYTITPFVVILTCNIAILVKMQAAAKDRARLQQSREGKNEKYKTKMVSTVFWRLCIQYSI